MNHKTWLLLAIFLTLATETFAARSARLFSEINFAKCLCSPPVPERLQRIQCMSQFLQDRRFTIREAVQYCGYTSYVTKFGRFTGRNLNMPTYNPWDFRYDLYTNETCRYSGYHPGADNPQYMAPETWVIVRCIFQVAGIIHEETTPMFWTCCRGPIG